MSMKKEGRTLLDLTGIVILSAVFILAVFSSIAGMAIAANCADQQCDNNIADGIVDYGKVCAITFKTWFQKSSYTTMGPFLNNWANLDNEWFYNSGGGWYWAQGNCSIGTYPRWLWINTTSGWAYGELNCTQNGANYCSGAPANDPNYCSPINIAGGDHCGSDWIITSNTEISGSHYNIRNFIINSGVTVTVKPFSGSSYGYVEIHAKNITVSGTLDASNAGYGGGGGGGGGASDGGWSGGYWLYGGSGGTGIAGGGSGGAGFNSLHYAAQGGYGGTAGGWGSGAGGAGGYVSGSANHGNNGANGGAGGYLISGANGDSSSDETLYMGSGGGGGGGSSGAAGETSSSSAGGGAGGGAGARGGGLIKLYASSKIDVSGTILAKGGTSGGNGAWGQSACNVCDKMLPGSPGGNAASSGSRIGGTGGNFGCYGTAFGPCGTHRYPTNVNYFGGYGGSGGVGGGGGILIESANINMAGTINNQGGSGSATNGGTLKIFCGVNSKSITGSIYSGRLFQDPSCNTPVDYLCIGAIDGNAQVCSGEDTELTQNTEKTLVDACTSSGKCEYTCQDGYIKNGLTCLKKFLDKPYWADLYQGKNINETTLSNTVLMVVPGTGLGGLMINYTVKREIDILFGLIKIYEILANEDTAVWEANVSSDKIYFKVDIDQFENFSDNLNIIDNSGGKGIGGGGVGNNPPVARLDNPTMNPKIFTSTNIPVAFTQSSYDADDLLNITWNFGDGVNQSFSDYAWAANPNMANVAHIYSSGNIYNIILTAKEQRDQDALSASAYSRIYVFQKGINVIPIISSPADGLAYGNLVNFDISQSYVANCSDNAGEITSPDLTPGNLYCKYIHAPGKTNIPLTDKYDLDIAWNVFDENGNKELSKNGSWAANYSNTVNFAKYFTRYAMHKASVSITYREK